MRVRNGEVSYDEAMLLADEYESKVLKIGDKSVLREKPDFEEINNWMVDMLVREIANQYGLS